MATAAPGIACVAEPVWRQRELDRISIARRGIRVFAGRRKNRPELAVGKTNAVPGHGRLVSVAISQHGALRSAECDECCQCGNTLAERSKADDSETRYQPTSQHSARTLEVMWLRAESV